MELVIEGLLKPSRPGVRPEQLIDLHRPIRNAPRATGVTEDVPGELALRVVALIDGLEGEALGLEAVEVFDLRAFQILRDEQGRTPRFL